MKTNHNLILIADLNNCRLELFENNYQAEGHKQLLDMPLTVETMVLDLGDSVFIKHSDTTRKFDKATGIPTTFVLEEDVKEEKTFVNFVSFVDWLRNIRNFCQ